uniref:DEAD/DEAH box helicase family protein n=1 Tax=Treponema endosymbiont of Eucomonympha sp. TaxID=1580831 RepID=UPI000A6B659E
MSTAKNTGELPLRFAAKLTRMANASYESGEMADRVTLVTRDLLRFWFSDTFTETRKFNFHDGQKQAILNTLFAHEVLKSKNVFDMYALADSDALAEMGTGEIAQKKYACSKYCIKMATGTGKTWVMHALLLWQYLNAKYAEAGGAPPECVFSKNFLLVAPGLIVYERLLDAFLGKETDDGTRSFETSDYHVFRELFIPDGYKNAAFGFIQNAVAKKDEIGKKVTGDGVIAVTNWHLLAGDGSETETADSSDPAAIVKDLLPITPGTTAGHSLKSLDSKFFSGAERDCLARLPDLVVINDEAHHIHETKTEGYADEVEWQKSLTVIAQGKGEKFIQVDFSATPDSETGNGQKRVKQYFPHIVVDFDLKTAIHKGLVKTTVLDKRKELASEQLADLDFRAERDEDGRPVALSEGQKIMLRAGLAKLRILETQFAALSPGTDKCPKMLAICEDTAVSPLVIAYLTQFEGLADEDVVQIDSDKKGSIPAPEWQSIKRTLFSVDRRKTPKVIVSVLMLREGFDVNNICVIVPLRRSQSDHLLEQIVGRGLRLMWRGEEYESIKAENRERLLVKKQEPSN